MKASSRAVWFCVVVAVFGLVVAVESVRYAIVWCAFWLGIAVFFVGTGRRLPMFSPLAPPASLADLGFPDAAMTGALDSPWWVLLLTGTAWACTMIVPVMSPDALAPAGIIAAVVLVLHVVWLHFRQRASAKIASALLGSAKVGRVVEGGLLRETFWFTITGVHEGSAIVQDVHGSSVSVATQTPTSNTYGYRQEERSPLKVEIDGVVRALHPDIWTTPHRVLPSAPALRANQLLSLGLAFVTRGVAWEEERVTTNQHVLVGEVRHRVVLFGADGDPARALRSALWQRRAPMIAMIALAGVALAAPLIR